MEIGEGTWKWFLKREEESVGGSKWDPAQPFPISFITGPNLHSWW